MTALMGAINTTEIKISVSLNLQKAVPLRTLGTKLQNNLP